MNNYTSRIVFFMHQTLMPHLNHHHPEILVTLHHRFLICIYCMMDESEVQNFWCYDLCVFSIINSIIYYTVYVVYLVNNELVMHNGGHFKVTG